MLSARLLPRILLATLALLALAAPVIPALGLGELTGTVPGASNPTCAAATTAPIFVWTTCTQDGDFHASNLTLSSNALVGGTLDAAHAHVQDAVVDGGVMTGFLLSEGPVSATGGAFSGGVSASSLTVSGPADVASLQLHPAQHTPACAEGKLSLVRNADGADVLQVCLRSAKGSLSWATLATG
jgi:hypothetical protein